MALLSFQNLGSAEQMYKYIRQGGPLFFCVYLPVTSYRIGVGA